jgi:hypothetical protein
MINHRHADHKVVPIFEDGCSVKIPYRGYEISLASDGSNTCIWSSHEDEPIFDVSSTNGESIKKAMTFIDDLIERLQKVKDMFDGVEPVDTPLSKRVWIFARGEEATASLQHRIQADLMIEDVNKSNIHILIQSILAGEMEVFGETTQQWRERIESYAMELQREIYK